MGYLNKSLAHDTILLKYFEDSGNQKNANIVKFRVQCTTQEINGDVDEEDEEDEEEDE